jgi:hypothetical protein
LTEIVAAWPSWVEAQAAEISTKLSSLAPIALEGPENLVLEPASGYNWVVDLIERSDLRSKIEHSLRRWLERPVSLKFHKSEEAPISPTRRPSTLGSREDRLIDDPLHQLIVERFEAKAVRVEADDEGSV